MFFLIRKLIYFPDGPFYTACYYVEIHKLPFHHFNVLNKHRTNHNTMCQQRKYIVFLYYERYYVAYMKYMLYYKL